MMICNAGADYATYSGTHAIAPATIANIITADICKVHIGAKILNDEAELESG